MRARESTVSSGTDKLTGLRNERKPCHFWVDNEVADCYQPIVGADAIWVYCRIARNAHGAWIVSPKRRDGDTRVSLREIAEWCGKSVDTVWRCLQVLEHVGLLQAMRGAKSSGRYALADVKELIMREGGAYDRMIGSFQLPPARVAELKQQVQELRVKLARKAADGKLAVVGGKKSVAQSDRLGAPLFSASEDECDSSVAQSDTSVAPDVQPSLMQKGKLTKQTTPPIAPKGALRFDGSDGLFTAEQLTHLAKYAEDVKKLEQWKSYYSAQNQAAAREQAKVAEVERAEGERIARLQAELRTVPAARGYVMRECGFTRSRRGRGIEQVIDDVLNQQLELGKALWETAPEMAAAWKYFLANGECIEVHWGPVKFYQLGIWRDSRGWAWNEAKLERRRGAAVGSAR